MKILMTHRYFWPDTAPYAVLMRVIAEHFNQQGHQVHVFASIPSYRPESGLKAPRAENIDGLHVQRVWVFGEHRKNPLARIANILLYCTGLFFHILRQRPDVVTAATFPPIFAAWTASIAARLIGAKFIYHCQDIHPEVSLYSGGLMGRGVFFLFFRWLDNQTLRRAMAVVVLSEDMANTLRARGIANLPLHVINNFLLESFDESNAPPAAFRKDPQKVRAIFAGNLGRFQNLPLLAEGIAACFDSNPYLELMFLGDGAALPALKARWGDHPQVRFSPFLPFAQAQYLISEADVGLVSLQDDIYRVAYPSKVLSYLGLGVPIFAMLEADSDLAQMLAQHHIGTASKYDIATAFSAFLTDLPLSEKVRTFYEKELSVDTALQSWSALISSDAKSPRMPT